MSETERQIEQAREILRNEISTWMTRIAEDRKIYRHLFLHGEFRLDVRIFHGLIIWGEDAGLWLAQFFMLIERQTLRDAAIDQILVHPRGY